ncbi:MAG: glycoside hydrolase family 16 protein, partial [Verrucomicrobia bacterium]|nr:glycoside hydrolase family 16 protein [Verrucomicrobiota bacterium]
MATSRAPIASPFPPPSSTVSRGPIRSAPRWASDLPRPVQLRLASLPCCVWLAAGLLPCAVVAAPSLVWSDEFNQPENSSPDPAKWTHDLGAGGWGNRELQRYTNLQENSRVVADPAALDGRALAIVARHSAPGEFTSARLKTQGKFAVTYGRIEARLKLPRGRGLWPAFWLLGESIARLGWPACGEIDIMEVVGHEPARVHATLHGPGYSGGQGLSASFTPAADVPLGERYHVFAVDWFPDRIEWSLDG